MSHRSRGSGGSSSRRRFLAALGTLFAGGGILSTGSYETVRANRATSVGTADDPGAILGMEGLGDSSTDNVFANNAAHTMDITLDARPYEDGIEWDVNDTVNDDDNDAGHTSFSLDPGGTAEVNVKGDDEVTFDGTAALRDGGREVGRVEVTRTIDVPVVNNLELSGDVSSNGNSGKFNFTLENSGSVDVELLEVGIVSTTNGDADYVTGGGSLLDANTGTEYVSQRIPFDSGTSDSTLLAMDPRPVLDSQADDGDGDPQSIDFTFDKFRSGSQGGPPPNMQGEDVSIELKVRNVEDDTITTAQVDLCSGSCS